MLKTINIPFVSKSKFGFRLSQVDLIFILLAILFTYLYKNNPQLPNYVNQLFHYFVPYLVMNFFLFCNVFRVKTKLELLWLSSAIVNILIYLINYQDIRTFFLSQSCITTFIILLEIKSPHYRGIFTQNKIQE